MSERRRPAMIALFLIGAALMSALAGISAVSRGVERLSERGAADLALASDRLEGQLLRYRQLAVFLADQPRIKAGLAPPPLRSDNITQLLQRAVDMTGSLDILVIRPDGEILEASDGREGRYPSAPEIHRALTGALGLKFTAP